MLEKLIIAIVFGVISGSVMAFVDYIINLYIKKRR